MNQEGKLQTITPSLRDSAPVIAPVSPAGVTAISADSISISTGRSPLESPQQVKISVEKASTASVAFFSLQNLVAMLPGWSVSLISHAVLLVILTVIATSPLRNASALKLDGQIVDASRIALDEEILTESEKEEVNLLKVDVAALNSEASEDTAEIIRDDGFDVSLLEGMSDGIGLEALAQSGLTPIANADKGGVQGKTEGTSTKFFGTEATGSRFVFIIDASGSMYEDNRWQHALRELSESINQLSEKQRVMVLLYNSHTIPMLNLPPKDLELLPASSEFKTALKEWLTLQIPVGRTRPAHALSFSLTMKPDAIFMLSDGLLADNSIEILARDNPASDPDDNGFKQIPIHTVSLGPMAEGAELMKLIADNNDGEFTWVK